MHTHLQDPIFKPRAGHPLHSRDDERVARGKAARLRVPRSRHAELDVPTLRAPLELLAEQERTRIPELVAIRHGRMAASPFAFYRGAAIIMAADLSRTPTSGLTTQLCGDAHLANFGMFGTPERELIFDLNDFDETLPGPWEWDLKRLAASIEIAGRENGYSKHDRHESVRDAVRCYRQTMIELASEGNLDVWYARLDTRDVVAKLRGLATHRQSKKIKNALRSAELHDSVRELAKLTEIRDGVPRIVSHPPLIVPLEELLAPGDRAAAEGAVRHVLDTYVDTLSDDRRALLRQYRLVEVAQKVVGVGSVGTRCWIALLAGIDDADPLFLQVKQADASVLERYLGASSYANHGERIVAGQRLMQGASDLLLGWTHAVGIDGQHRDFYVRQLRDWKASVALETLRPEGMTFCGRLCGWTLARAHARSSDRVALASYLGKSDRFDEAIVAFAGAYADQNERDHAELVRAIKSGRLAAEAPR